MKNVHASEIAAKYLTRKEFREGVFERQNNKCAMCDAVAVDAHHIIERRLWTAQSEAGGYFLENGAGVCEYHHLEAEATTLPPDVLRTACGIEVALIPDQFYTDQEISYDKWGNQIIDGVRHPGPLWDDESVRKIMGLHEDGQIRRYKYPRTLHLPWSEGRTDDDKVHPKNWWPIWDMMATEKMDGENTTIYPDGYMHARSIDSEHHESQDRLRSEIQRWCYELPPGYRVCGENLTAKHSIKYSELDDIFQVFSIWEGNRCLSWAETEEWCDLLDLTVVPVIHRETYPIWNMQDTHASWLQWCDQNGDESEGYVVRPQQEFTMAMFSQMTGKYVRKDHVTSDRHWKHKKVEYNGIR